jgi:2-keto-4-pentenoate hydratase/2-oxohepta-3-ene-1,7-dioic acid hydratase in catechol pathway
MKLMSFCLPDDASPRLGCEHGSDVLDLTAAASESHRATDPRMTLSGIIGEGQGLDNLKKMVASLGLDIVNANLTAASGVRLLAPVPRPAKIFGIGLNYHDHAEEIGMDKPAEPLLFAMFANTVIAPEDPILIPAMSSQIDYEAELAVIIGRRGRHIEVANALEHVAGYTIVNDVSARDLQFKDSQWIRGKSFDTFLPMGPVVVPTSELGDAGNLDIQLRLNGQTMQQSNTRNLIFNVPELVSYISRIATLEPGDIIATGTPGGVGFARKPPVFLRAGDVIEIEIEGIGTLRNPVSMEGS